MNLKVYKKILLVAITGTVLVTTPNVGNITYAKEIEEQNDETFLEYLNDLKEETIEYLNSKEVLENKEKIIDNFRPNASIEVKKIIDCYNKDLGSSVYECPSCNDIIFIGHTCKSRFCSSFHLLYSSIGDIFGL